MKVEFLSVEEVLDIHAAQLERYGGGAGLGDKGLLDKRTGLLSALVFLDLNGVAIEHGSEALYELTIAVAQGRARKAEVAAELQRVAAMR